MRHRVYSKDATERTVPQRQENTGKAAVVGRWAEKEEKGARRQRGNTRKETARTTGKRTERLE